MLPRDYFRSSILNVTDSGHSSRTWRIDKARNLRNHGSYLKQKPSKPAHSSIEARARQNLFSLPWLEEMGTKAFAVAPNGDRMPNQAPSCRSVRPMRRATDKNVPPPSALHRIMPRPKLPALPQPWLLWQCPGPALFLPLCPIRDTQR